MGKNTRSLSGVLLIVVLAVSADVLAQDSAASLPLPLEEYARLPPLGDIALSPDGTKAVALRAIGDTYHAVLHDFAAGESRLLMASDPEQFLFNWCRFANAKRVVCSIRSYIELRAGQIGLALRAYRDGRTVARRLLAIDVDGNNQMQLIPEARSRTRGDLEWNDPYQDVVVSWLKDEPNHILVAVAREDRTRRSVYRLNINNNRMKRVQGFVKSVTRWYADETGELRFATGYRERSEPVAFAIRKGKRNEVDLTHLGGLDAPGFAALAPDGKSAWVYANMDRDTRGLHRIDIQTGQFLDTLAHHDLYDMAGLRVHPVTRKPIYARFTGETEQMIWFDDDTESHMRAVRKATGSPSLLRIVTMSADASRAVVWVSGNGVDPSHYLYTFADRSLALLAKHDLGPPVEFKPISYKARDGLEIPGYLALPGPAEDGPYPTVIRPHGGPWARSTAGHSFITQYLVHAGYAVLRPNFRGSTGYGDAFTSAGFKEWGQAMQRDVVDGIDWMVAQGYADPQRICIAGGSYGGYVAAVASYQTPEKIQCAVSFAGVADLGDIVQRSYAYEFGRFTTARIQRGDARDAADPMRNIERIQVPLLLVHGDVDTTVVVDQSRGFAEALEAAGKPYRYVEQPNGDHHYSLQSHRLQYLEELDAFLREHIGERRAAVSEPPPRI